MAEQKPKKKKEPILLTKEQQKQIQKRMSDLKKRNLKNDSATQTMIPYIEMLKDGICYVEKGRFSRTIEFFDTNYEIADFDEKNSIFSAWCNLLNYFDDSIDFQFSYENQKQNLDEELEKIRIAEQQDRFNAVRKEYSDMLCNLRKNSKSGYVLRKFLTFTISEKNIKSARKKLDSIAEEIIRLFAELSVNAFVLDGKQRLEVLYRSLNPSSDERFIFDWGLKTRGGYSTKDFIAPMSARFRKNKFELNDSYGMITSIDILAGELSDRALCELLESGGQVSVSIHIKSFDQLKALKLVRGKLSDVEKMKIDEQKKASMSGYDPDILPQQIKLYIDELNELLADLNSRNERLFNITLTMRNYSKSEKKALLEIERLKRLVQQKSCKLYPLDYMQEQAFASFLPIGYNSVPIVRALPTSALGVFIPFTTQELYQEQGCYYGLNVLTRNMIMADRAKLKNPNGLIFGTPGSGKSFSVKREIVDRYLKTTSDIIITDPEGEYFPLVNYLGGQVIKISSNSTQFINPMDINIHDEEEDKIANKSNFLISLCELIVGGRYGLEAEEKTVIDIATRNVYNNFFAHSPSRARMPILADLVKALRSQGEVAQRVANSLEMYVSGSQNLFNSRYRQSPCLL